MTFDVEAWRRGIVTERTHLLAMMNEAVACDSRMALAFLEDIDDCWRRFHERLDTISPLPVARGQTERTQNANES